MDELWEVLGGIIVAVLTAGIVVSVGIFIEKVWKHINAPHTTQIGVQYNVADMDGLNKILGELAGSASMCWKPKPIGVFDATQALKLTSDARQQIIEWILKEIVPSKKPTCEAYTGDRKHLLMDECVQLEIDRNISYNKAIDAVINKLKGG